jgi:hypothetical protein
MTDSLASSECTNAVAWLDRRQFNRFGPNRPGTRSVLLAHLRSLARATRLRSVLVVDACAGAPASDLPPPGAQLTEA